MFLLIKEVIVFLFIFELLFVSFQVFAHQPHVPNRYPCMDKPYTIADTNFPIGSDGIVPTHYDGKNPNAFTFILEESDVVNEAAQFDAHITEYPFEHSEGFYPEIALVGPYSKELNSTDGKGLPPGVSLSAGQGYKKVTVGGEVMKFHEPFSGRELLIVPKGMSLLLTQKGKYDFYVWEDEGNGEGYDYMLTLGQDGLVEVNETTLLRRLLLYIFWLAEYKDLVYVSSTAHPKTTGITKPKLMSQLNKSFVGNVKDREQRSQNKNILAKLDVVWEESDKYPSMDQILTCF